MTKTIKIISPVSTFGYKNLMICPGKEFEIDEIDFKPLAKAFGVEFAPTIPVKKTAKEKDAG